MGPAAYATVPSRVSTVWTVKVVVMVSLTVAVNFVPGLSSANLSSLPSMTNTRSAGGVNMRNSPLSILTTSVPPSTSTTVPLSVVVFSVCATGPDRGQAQ